MAIRQMRRLIERAGVLDNAPGPSPWYLRTGKPAVPGFTWVGAGDSGQTAGATVLSGCDGVVFDPRLSQLRSARSPDAARLASASRRNGTQRTRNAAHLSSYDLRPLEGDLEQLCGSMRRSGAPFMASGSPRCEFPIPTTATGCLMRLKFPDQLRHIEELLICATPPQSRPHRRRSSTTWRCSLLVRAPARTVLPQDWFNSANLDYGYQWVTRVARDPQTGRIHGDGIRISPFVLDDTLRNAL